MTPLCHRLRTLLGGELGNEAADEIEWQAECIAEMKESADRLVESMCRAPTASKHLTIETVAQWLATQGLTAVRTVDVERRPWQPIETAPLGRILVRDADMGLCVASAGWSTDTPTEIRWGVVNDITVNPTHWMPLPLPPQLEQYARHTDECLKHRRKDGLRMAVMSDFILPCICGFKNALEQKQ